MTREELSLVEAFKESREKIARRIDVGGNETWGVYGKSVTDYESSFSNLLHGAKIADLLRHKKAPFVVDLMSPTTALARLFEQMHPKQDKSGLALGLVDMRSAAEKTRDQDLGIRQLTGDLTRRDTWRLLAKETETTKADLIMERAVGGIDVLPVHGLYYGYAIRKLWNMLSPNDGTLIIDIPTHLYMAGIDMAQWVATLNENGVEAESDNTLNLRITKKPDSTLVLPC